MKLDTYILTMGPNATNIGNGDVTGIITRTSISPNIEYTYGHQFSSITFPNFGTIPTSLSIKVVIGSTQADRPGGINRYYDVIQTGGSFTKAIVKVHYLDSELNGNDESKLVNFSINYPGPVFFEHGKSSHDENNDWITLSNINIAFFTSSFGNKAITLDESELTVLTWTGAVSTSWITVENWWPYGAPSSGVAIVIPDASTTARTPSLPATSTVKSILIQDGGLLEADSNAQLTLSGSMNAWSNQGEFIPRTSTIIFTNANATISGVTQFYNLTVDSAAELLVSQNAFLKISNNFQVTGSLRAGLLDNTIEYNGANQNIALANGGIGGYFKLIASGSGTKTFPSGALSINSNFTSSGTVTLDLNGNITSKGPFTIGTGCSLNGNSYTHTFKKDLIANGSINPGTSTFTFDGAIPQTISGATTPNFYNLTLNNGTATLSNSTLTLEKEITVSGNLNLTRGYLQTTTSNLLKLSAGSTTSGSSASSFVAGPMTKSGTTAFVFPIGNDGKTKWARIGMSAPTSSSTFKAQYFNQGYSNVLSMATSPAPVLHNVSTIEYWNFEKTSGTGNTKVTLHWEDANFSQITDCSTSDLRVAFYNGTEWENADDNVATTGTCFENGAGTVSTNNNLANFGIFSFGSRGSVSNPLPIVLTSFQGSCNKGEARFNWSTASETNNNFFTVEKSENGESFKAIATVKSKGNTTLGHQYDLNSNVLLNGKSYFRLKQTDFDGKVTYSKTIAFSCDSKQNSALIYPNPTKGDINISGIEVDAKIRIVSMIGEIVYAKTSTSNTETFSLPKLPNGVYFVQIISNGNIQIQKILLTQ